MEYDLEEVMSDSGVMCPRDFWAEELVRDA